MPGNNQPESNALNSQCSVSLTARLKCSYNELMQSVVTPTNVQHFHPFGGIRHLLRLILLGFWGDNVLQPGLALLMSRLILNHGILNAITASSAYLWGVIERK